MTFENQVFLCSECSQRPRVMCVAALEDTGLPGCSGDCSDITHEVISSWLHRSSPSSVRLGRHTTRVNALADKPTSCLNWVRAASHSSRRDKVPWGAALGLAAASGSWQVFGRGAQPAWHLPVSWQLQDSLLHRELLSLEVIRLHATQQV